MWHRKGIYLVFAGYAQGNQKKSNKKINCFGTNAPPQRVKRETGVGQSDKRLSEKKFQQHRQPAPGGLQNPGQRGNSWSTNP
jgi:hypothetical protein